MPAVKSTRQSPVAGRPPSFAWLNWRYCGAITAATFLLTLGLLWAFGPALPFAIYVLLALVPAILVFIQFNGMRAATAKRRTVDWQWQVQPDAETRAEGLWESSKLFDSFRHILADSMLEDTEREDKIYVFKRFHPVSLLPWIAAPMFLGVAAAITAVFYFGRLPWYVWLAVEVAAWLSVWLLSLKWRYTVIMVTNRYLRMVTRWPIPLAPWLRSDSEALELDYITTHDSKDSSLANLLGLNYGVLVADSASSEDEWANWMPFVQRSDRVNRYIGAAKSSRAE